MSDDNTGQDNTKDEDGFADAIAALSMIAVVIVTVVVWLGNQ